MVHQPAYWQAHVSGSLFFGYVMTVLFFAIRSSAFVTRRKLPIILIMSGRFIVFEIVFSKKCQDQFLIIAYLKFLQNQCTAIVDREVFIFGNDCD